MVDTSGLPDLLYQADIAKLRRCSIRTLERYRRSKRFPDPLGVPGRPSWSREDILEWLKTGGVPRRARR
jgi:hypothetical protein